MLDNSDFDPPTIIRLVESAAIISIQEDECETHTVTLRISEVEPDDLKKLIGVILQ